MLIRICCLGCAVMFSACARKQQAAPAHPTAVVPQPAKKAEHVQVARGPIREALVALRRVHFAYDSSRLLPGAKAALNDAAEKLRSHPDVQLYVDGHADERGTVEYNLALGKRRARAAAAYLNGRGIPSARLNEQSFGKTQPLRADRSVVAWAMNRRTEFRLMRGTVRLVLEEGALVDDRGRPMPTPDTTGAASLKPGRGETAARSVARR